MKQLKSFDVMVLVAGLVALILVACAPALAAQPTEQPTEQPEPVGEVVVEPTEAVSEPQDGQLLTIFRHGGLCMVGNTCEWTMTINNDGTYLITSDAAPAEGALSAERLAELQGLIGETDFQAILDTPFTDVCPIAYDGQESIYTITTADGTVELASCTVTIDPSAPLFALIDQIIAEATAAG